MIRVAARPAATALSAHAECHTAHIETPEERTRRIWRSADAVAFDVDSTVCQDEAIDELANYLGVGEAVANVTRQAMNGNARFRHALQARLEVMRPTYDQLEAYANETKPKGIFSEVGTVRRCLQFLSGDEGLQNVPQVDQQFDFHRGSQKRWVESDLVESVQDFAGKTATHAT
ncbi:hypothetical protein Y032_0002g1104 [Ancylostoma ceylanicum]|uniref:Phosphoserine phosphatase n=1 Tax=Ancylostoma ceylanicum TaxID=53326 RepID=A0A016VYX2_9BILA|nr:hypothetical protein Y032_0002g1104 [Ancylostoma ceylanicum]